MKKYILLAIIAASLFACSEKKLPPVNTVTNLIGLSSPIVVEPGENEIILSDYYTNTDIIDDVRVPGYPDSLYHYKDGYLYINSWDGMSAAHALEITAYGITETIPLFRTAKQSVELTYDPRGQEHENVTVKGEFNGWTPGRPDLEFRNGMWSATLMLNPGMYQYLLVIDGVEALDPANTEKIDNNMGGFNSVLNVGIDIPEKVPQIYTLTYSSDEIEIGLDRDVDGVMVYWQNVLLPKEYIALSGDHAEIQIPSEAGSLKRSAIRIWAWNKHGVSNDLLIPLENGKVLDDPGEISRHDLHSMILYNAFVDRFNDADPDNNRKLDLKEVLPQADYHGGDIKGVTEKIRDGYFRSLGVNTIWISPIVKNPEGAFGFWPDPPSKFSGYHGYWPVSFTQIDDRYGTEEDLHELVKVAHENNMNVLLDFVANHVHQEHPVYQANKEWATQLYLPDGSLNTERWDEHRLTTWFDVFLPTLDLEKPEVYEMLSDSAVYWIKKYKLDGFRHDATKHIPEVFWRTLTRKLKQEVMEPEDRMLYQIGETYGGPELINSYVSSGMLDAQFDFNVYDDAIAVLIRPEESFERLNASLRESLQYYGAHNLMGYISGNQDRGRFTSYAGGGLRFDEDPKLAGWTRNVFVGRKEGYKATEMLFAFNMTIPGLPVIYYGDEIGMPGGNDPDNRRMMRFDNLTENEEHVKDVVSRLAFIRAGSLPLIYGDFETLLVEKDLYAYCRTYFNDIVIIVMNKSAATKNITFALPERFTDSEVKSNFGFAPGIKGGMLSVTLGPKSFDVLTLKE